MVFQVPTISFEVYALSCRLSTIQAADRIVVMDKGRIVEVGSWDELLGLEGGLFGEMVRACGRGCEPVGEGECRVAGPSGASGEEEGVLF